MHVLFSECATILQLSGILVNGNWVRVLFMQENLETHTLFATFMNFVLVILNGRSWACRKKTIPESTSTIVQSQCHDSADTL